MSVYDIVMITILVGAAFFGYRRGFVRQIASIASIVVGYLVAISFREPFSKIIPTEEPWNRIIAMGILFLATSLLIWSIYASAQKSLKRMELKGFDHQVGGMLGAVKGLLICCIITMFAVSLLGKKAHEEIHNSRSGYLIVRTIYQVAGIIPREIWPYVNPYFQRFDDSIGTSDNLQDFQKYRVEEQGIQDPLTVPRYTGQWQVPNNSANTSGSDFSISQWIGQSNQQPSGQQGDSVPLANEANRLLNEASGFGRKLLNEFGEEVEQKTVDETRRWLRQQREYLFGDNQ